MPALRTEISFARVFAYMTTTFEDHYTPAELAVKWKCSTKTVNRLCEKIGGVFVINRPAQINKRGYKTFRIPASTADRMFRAHFAPPRYSVTD